MNEIALLEQLLQNMPLHYIGIGVLFILLLIVKNNFSQPPNIPSSNHTSFFAIFILLFAIVPAALFGWGFYQAYYPNYRYTEVSNQQSFHLYQPGYLPNGVQQETAYAVTEKPLFTDSPSVSAVFGTAMKNTSTEASNQLIMLMQSGVPADFALLPYLEKRDETSAPLMKAPTAISIASFPGTSAYVVQTDFVTQLYLLTNDNVLIVTTAPSNSTPLEELIKIVESLH